MTAKASQRQRARMRRKRDAALAESTAPLAKPTVMIFADASFDSTEQVAGWAAWIKSDGTPSFTVQGQLRGDVPNSAVAEARALANACAAASHRGLLAADAVVMLQSDCLSALTALRLIHPPARCNQGPGVFVPRRLSPLRASLAEPIRVIAGYLAEVREAQVRHVKGHTHGADGRSKVNALCDQLAKAEMRAARRAKRYAATQAEKVEEECPAE